MAEVAKSKSKLISSEEVGRYGRAELGGKGGDPYARSLRDYSKHPPPRELDEYDEL